VKTTENSSIREATFRVVVTGRTVSVSAVSDGVQALLGYSPADFLAGTVTLTTLIHRDDQDIADTLFSPDIQRTQGDCNLRLRQANGRILCVKGHYSREAVANGVAVDLLFQDAKSLPRTMADAATNDNLATMLAVTDDYIYFKDRNHVVTGASQTLVSLCPPARHWTDLIGQTDYDIFTEEFADLYYRLEKQVFAGIPIAKDVQETLSSDGRRGWVDNRKYAIRDASGVVIGLYGIARDITTYKQAEEVLNAGEAKFRAIVDAISVPMALNDRSQRITYLNQAFTHTFGYGLEDIPTLADWWARAYPDPAYRQWVNDTWSAELARMRHTGTAFEPIEVRIRCQDGTDRVVLSSASLMEDAFEGCHLVMLHDITARKQAEETLRLSERRWRFAIDGAGDGLWDWNVPAGTVFFSTRWKEMLGFAEGEIGSGLDEWSRRIHPDDRARVLADLEAHLTGTSPQYTSEHRVSCKDGHWKWILDRGLVVERDAAGKAVRMIGTHTDVTERRLLGEAQAQSLATAQRSRRALLSALEDQQRVQVALTSSMRDKDALVKEIHHRVKNNLQVISSLLRLESARHTAPDLTSVLEDLGRRVHSMALLHDQLHRAASFAEVDLGAYLEQLSRYCFSSLAPPSGAIQLHLQLAPVAVSMDQAVACGLLVNELITNTMKHGFPAGRDGEVRIELLPVEGGPEARLRISDTGVGLPADFATRRTKSLGLQLATDLARQVGGTLEIGPGPEAVFSVTFVPAPVPGSRSR
jgi:PAS domain S-box-containing protein